MAYIVTEHAPQPVFFEQAPPPVIIQHEPQPVLIQQAPPPVVFQPAPAPVPVYIEHAPPTVIVQPAPQPAPVVQAPAPVFRPSLRGTPASVKCNLCQQQVITMTEPIIGLCTWITVGVLFIFLIWPLCLIPFCTKSCKDVKHTCPNCQNVIHVYKQM